MAMGQVQYGWMRWHVQELNAPSWTADTATGGSQTAPTVKTLVLSASRVSSVVHFGSW